MKVQLPVDPFNLTQGFGEHPEWYTVFGLKGHNGWDVRTKYPDTPAGFRNILATQDTQFYKQANEGNKGYGLYFEVLTKAVSLWKHTFAHCNSIESFNEKKQSEVMAISDNTGNSTASHLHWTVKRIKVVNGVHEVQNYNNGYFGAVNPQEYLDEVRNYNGAQPMPETNITVSKEQYEKLVRNASVKEEVAKYLDIVNPDLASKEDFIRVIGGFKSRITDLSKQLGESQTEVQNRIDQVRRLEKQLLDSDKLRAELTEKLSDALSEQGGLVGVYEKRLKELQNDLDVKARELGNINKLLGECKSQAPVADLSIADVLVLLFNKLRGVKLK